MNDNVEDIASVAALLVVGRVLKGVPRFPDEWIPTSLSVAGLLLVCLTQGWTVAAVIKGFALGLSAVGTNQLYRQHTAEKPKPE